MDYAANWADWDQHFIFVLVHVDANYFIPISEMNESIRMLGIFLTINEETKTQLNCFLYGNLKMAYQGYIIYNGDARWSLGVHPPSSVKLGSQLLELMIKVKALQHRYVCIMLM